MNAYAFRAELTTAYIAEHGGRRTVSFRQARVEMVLLLKNIESISKRATLSSAYHLDSVVDSRFVTIGMIDVILRRQSVPFTVDQHGENVGRTSLCRNRNAQLLLSR